MSNPQFTRLFEWKHVDSLLMQIYYLRNVFEDTKGVTRSRKSKERQNTGK
jgi:hypothetical protein